MTATLRGCGETGYFDEELTPCTKPSGVWCGSLAPLLGLAGNCTKADFYALQRGVHPINGDRLRPRQSSIAWQGFVFSVPLSVSVAGMFDVRIHRWFVEAMAATVPAIESCALVRDQRGGRLIRRAPRVPGLVMAWFGHTASRADEPALHHHLLVANITNDGEATVWRSLDAHELYRRQALLNCCFLADLAKRLVLGGYQLEPRPDGYEFEISGMPLEGLHRQLASRRRQISDRLPKEVLSPKQRRRLTDQLALETRAEKRADSETTVTEALAKLEPSVLATVRKCVDASCQRFAGGMAPKEVPTPNLASECSRYFQSRWLATDVTLLVAIAQANWGQQLPFEIWRRELAETKQGWTTIGDNLYLQAAQLGDLEGLEKLRVLSVAVGLEDSARVAAILPPTSILVSLEGASVLARHCSLSICRPEELGPLSGHVIQPGSVVVVELAEPSRWHPHRLASLAKAILGAGATPLLVVFEAEAELDRSAVEILLRRTVKVSFSTPPFQTGNPCRVYGVATVDQPVTAILEGPLGADQFLVEQVAASFAERRRQSAFVPDSSTHRQLCLDIRHELIRRGTLTGTAREVVKLLPCELRWPRLSWDDLSDVVLQFAQNVRGHQRGSRVTVLDIEGGDFIVRDEKGDVSYLVADQAMPYRAFRRRSISLQPGDCIRLTEPRRAGATLRLSTARIYPVVDVSGDGSITLSNGARLEDGFGHIEYAYACAEPDRFGCTGAIIPTADFVGETVAELAKLVGRFSRVTLLAPDAQLVAAQLGLELNPALTLADVLKTYAHQVSSPESSRPAIAAQGAAGAAKKRPRPIATHEFEIGDR